MLFPLQNQNHVLHDSKTSDGDGKDKEKILVQHINGVTYVLRLHHYAPKESQVKYPRHLLPLPKCLEPRLRYLYTAGCRDWIGVHVSGWWTPSPSSYCPRIRPISNGRPPGVHDSQLTPIVGGRAGPVGGVRVEGVTAQVGAVGARGPPLRVSRSAKVKADFFFKKKVKAEDKSSSWPAGAATCGVAGVLAWELGVETMLK